MRTTLLVSVMAALLALNMGGCASNPIVGHGVDRADHFYGDVGVTGNGGNVRIMSGSRVTKLSIIGDNNTVTVEDDVTLYRIEFWGKGNTVLIPEDLFLLRTTQVGSNAIVRRPSMRPALPAVGESSATALTPLEETRTAAPAAPPRDETRRVPPQRSEPGEEADGMPSNDEK